MADCTIYETVDGITTLTLNQPERQNALGAEMAESIIASLERFRVDEEGKVLIITGAGKTFCAGGDVKKMGEGHSKDDSSQNRRFDPIAVRERYREGIHRMPRTFAKIEKPIIAAVNGASVGAGFDLSLMSDIRIAGEHARFGAVFCRIGLAPGDGCAFFLTRIVGIEKACELIFTGDVIDAQEALRIGMVSRVVPNDTLMDEARALAARMAKGPTLALTMAKFAIYRGMDQTLDESLEMMALMQGMLHGTEDHREGVRAFIEKRPPKFTGR